jgi:biotin carboxyl carrier protein
LIHQDGAHYVLEVEEPDDKGFINRKRIRAAGYRDGDSRQLWANGRMVDYRLVQEGLDQTPDTSDPSLSVSIPAVVSEVLVKVGQRVKSGEKLILLESMKMILPIRAPFDGVIQSINCALGEAVQPGLQLIDLSELS